MDFLQFFLVFFIVVPLLFMWGFALVDIFRRHDLGGWAKALWLVAVLFVPWIGTLVYIIARTPVREMVGDDTAPSPAGAQPTPAPTPQMVAAGWPPVMIDPVEQLKTLGELRRNGTLTEEEFQQEKARVLAAASVATANATALPTVSAPTVALPPMNLPGTTPPATDSLTTN
jgi:hypothetical protein